ncbi:MAG: site-2 protease family protein [Planctomycetota bacterium]
MDWSSIILLYLTLLISLTFHEAGHAVVATLGGDRTAYLAGQVTLNPLPHMRREPFGTVLFPLLALLMSNGTMVLGFASVPLDPVWAFHHPRKAALVSLAGPAANVLLAAGAFLVLWVVDPRSSHTAHSIGMIAGAFLELNLLLAVFNLVPFPPLDGAGIVSGFAPSTRRFYEVLARTPYAGLIVLILMLRFLPSLFGPVSRMVWSWLPY